MKMFVFNALLVIAVFTSSTRCDRPKCGLYGAPPCVFLPAPPGQTPPCARPGQTYCERMPHYPKNVVRNLINRYGSDLSKLLTDETAEDFSAITPPYYPPVSAGYDYPHPNPAVATNVGYNYAPPNTIYTYQEEPIYIPRPRPQQPKYLPPQYSPQPRKFASIVVERQQVTEYNPAEAFRRYTRDISKKLVSPELKNNNDKKTRVSSGQSEFLFQIQHPKDIIFQSSNGTTRSKRQTFGRQQLCEVNTQFIMPQAALNNKGNWMYVINQDDVSRQLVKTETCASTVCSNLCQLPIGYNSRCEQKFIQKRLIALDGNGQSFYTDTFWFPSCCVCTLSNQ